MEAPQCCLVSGQFGRALLARCSPAAARLQRFILSLCLLLTVYPRSVAAATGYRTDRILIQPRPATVPRSLEDFHRSKGGRRLKSFQRLSGIQVIEVPAGTQPATLIERYRNSGLVEVAEPDFLVEATSAPSDPNYQNGALWYLNHLDVHGNRLGPDIQAALAWETKTNADNIVVALIDTGIRLTHEDLAGNLWVNPKEIPGNGVDDDGNGFVDDVHGMDAANQTGVPVDLVGHGSRVAGVIGASADNARGGVGVAWKINMMICRYSNNSGQGSFSDILECFDYARANGARIINASFGSTNTSTLLLNALNACRSAGIIVVAGAGNNGTDNDATPFYPASYGLDNVISVAATTRDDSLAGYSNFGRTSVDLAAPGTDILSTGHASDSDYVYDSGTSYSTAITSGALALLWARFPTETYLQIVQRLLGSVDPLPALAGRCVTGGRLNLARALGPSLVADFSFNQTASSGQPALMLQDTSFGNINRRQWDFGDGSSSEELAPSHTFPYFGEYPVRLTVSTPTGSTASAEKNVLLSANYSVASAPYDWLTPDSVTTLTLANDGVSAASLIPFPFTYYGIVRTQVFVGANGIAGFVSPGLSSVTNTDLPTPTQPNDVLSPYWSDLSPNASTRITIGTKGSAPARSFVITWDKISLPAPQTATVSFQVVLRESTGEIMFNYKEVATTSRNANAAGKKATIGMENGDGTVGVRFSYLGSASLTNSQAIRFTPPAKWPGPGVLQRLDSSHLLSVGTQGSSPEPPGQVATLTNSGESTLRWSAQSTVPWMVLDRLAGTLMPGQAVPLGITLTPQASLLEPGSHVGEIRLNGTNLVIEYEVRIYRPVRLLSPAQTAGGALVFQMQGDASTSYVLEETEDLLRWVPISTNLTDPSGNLLFTQPITAGFPRRFFRATRLDSVP